MRDETQACEQRRRAAEGRLSELEANWDSTLDSARDERLKLEARVQELQREVSTLSDEKVTVQLGDIRQIAVADAQVAVAEAQKLTSRELELMETARQLEEANRELQRELEEARTSALEIGREHERAEEELLEEVR